MNEMKFALIFALVFVLLAGCTQSPPAQNINQTPLTNSTTQNVNTNGTAQSGELVSTEISFYTEDGWYIYGNLYPSKDANVHKAIILAHMRAWDRNSYPHTFISKLHNGIPDAVIVTIDLRGHGQSTNLGTLEAFNSGDYVNMSKDIIAAKNRLKEANPGITEVYVIGASIGSTAAITAGALDSQIDRIVMISPGLDYQEVDIRPALRSYNKPLLLISSDEDSESKADVASIIGISASANKQQKSYQIGHGTEIFGNEGNDQTLDDVIANFLKN